MVVGGALETAGAEVPGVAVMLEGCVAPCGAAAGGAEDGLAAAPGDVSGDDEAGAVC